MTAYELRMHLQQVHSVRLAGLDYGSLTTIHSIEHRPGADQDHIHDDGPGPAHWEQDCSEFGCGGLAPTKRVLVCGSRNLSEKRRQEVIDALEYLWRRHPLVVIHGAAPGADAFAEHWALRRGCEQIAFPADWAHHGRKAGPIRNQQMLAEGKPDIVLAFPEKDSKGTWDMVKRAQQAGLEVLVQTGVGLSRLADHSDDCPAS